MAAPTQGEHQREHEHVPSYPGWPVTLQLRTRLVIWYCGTIGSITAIPWIALALTDVGLSDGQAATALLLLPIGHLLGAPSWSWVADRTDPRAVIRWATGGAAVASIGLALSPTALPMVLALAALAAFRGGVFPVGDALTLGLLGDERRSYGQIRAAGSVVFALAILVDGLIKDAWPAGPLWIGAGLMVVAAVVSWQLPRPPALGGRPGIADLLRVARDPVLATMAVVAVLHGLTITTYDSLYTLHIEAMGLPSWVAGASMAVGVTVEVGVLWLARRWLRAIGPLPLLAIAVASGIPRWWLTATTTDPLFLSAAQALHGLGFGAWWAAGVALFNERAPRSLASSAQSLFTVATFGLGHIASMVLAARVLQTHDTQTLFAGMAGVSGLALLLVLAVAWRSHAGPDRGDRT